MTNEDNPEVLAADDQRVYAALRATTFNSMLPVAFSLGLLYVIYTINGVAALSELKLHILVPLRIISAITCFLIYIAYRQNHVHESRAYPLGGFMVGIVVLNSGAHSALDPELSTYD
jgi:hypothetical protein